MRRLALRIAYLGWLFHGSQVQGDVLTVQGELHRALGRTVKFASRTDRGVSSLANVATVDVEGDDHILALTHRWNRSLDGLAITGVAEVAPDFSARRQARGRRYSYYLGIIGEAELQAWAEICPRFLGRHDFGLFANMQKEQSPMKDLDRSELVKISGGWYWLLESRSFLWHQVRGMVWAVERILAGQMSMEQLDAMLSGEGNRASAADPDRLVLRDVFYEPHLDWQVVETPAWIRLLNRLRIHAGVASSFSIPGPFKS